MENAEEAGTVTLNEHFRMKIPVFGRGRILYK